MIKAICFDLDGVYFTAESFPRFMKSISDLTTKNDSVEFVLKGDMMQEFKKGNITENQYWDYVREQLEIDTPNETIFELLRDSYEVNSDVVDYVRAVKQAGFSTCICSNNFETRVRELNEKFDFLKEFDVDILSYQVQALKPSVEIFKELVHKSNCLPEEIVFSDDNEAKLEGAKELGINTFVYTDFYSFKQKLETLGVRV